MHKGFTNFTVQLLYFQKSFPTQLYTQQSYINRKYVKLQMQDTITF